MKKKNNFDLVEMFIMKHVDGTSDRRICHPQDTGERPTSKLFRDFATATRLKKLLRDVEAKEKLRNFSNQDRIFKRHIGFKKGD